MLREISEEVRINLKDRLRDVRHAIRQRRHDSAGGSTPGAASFPIREIEGLFGHAVSAFDDVMSVAETLVPRELSGRMAGLAPKPLGVYFGARDDSQRLAGERAFRRDMYALTRAVLAEKKREDARVREAGFAAAHAAMERHCGELFERLAHENEWTGRVALTASLCAALLLECLVQETLRFDEPLSAASEAERRSCAISCLAPVALACGLATVDVDAAREPDLLEIAMLATDAELDRILPACEAADALDELTAIFAALLAHLP